MKQACWFSLGLLLESSYGVLGQSNDSVCFVGNIHRIAPCFVPASSRSLIQNVDWNSTRVLYLFSSSVKTLDSNEVRQLGAYVYAGGSLYLGFDNAPFQREGQQLLSYLFDRDVHSASVDPIATLGQPGECLNAFPREQFPSGTSVASFPMDYRWHVIAWSEDQPLLVLASVGNGIVLLDGGYARFYDDSPEIIDTWNAIQTILLSGAKKRP